MANSNGVNFEFMTQFCRGNSRYPSPSLGRCGGLAPMTRTFHGESHRNWKRVFFGDLGSSDILKPRNVGERNWKLSVRWLCRLTKKCVSIYTYIYIYTLCIYIYMYSCM